MKMLIAAAALGAAAAAQPSAQQLVAQQPDLTREQARDRAEQLFDRFDLNHDGFVTHQESQSLGRKLLLLRASTGRDVAPGIGGHTLRFLEHRFRRLEAVTKQQFEAAFLAHSMRWIATTTASSPLPSARSRADDYNLVMTT